MSFSSEVKEELSGRYSKSRHCNIAEIAAIMSMCGHIVVSQFDRYAIRISTENLPVARKYFTLLKKTFNIDTEISIRYHAYIKKARTYTIVVKDHEDALRLIQAVKLMDENGELGEKLSVTNQLILMKDCCKKAYLRGAFLAAGSITDPNRFYHFEISCATMPKALQLQALMLHFQLDAKIVERKKHFVVYIKEGDAIVDILSLMEAPVALMKLENIRILKDMRNSVNRKVNCETANLNKTVKTAYKQIEDIRMIEQYRGLQSLPENLRQMAEIRLENPEASLVELGKILDPPVGKSGVNHRLRRLSEIAGDIRSRNQF